MDAESPPRAALLPTAAVRAAQPCFDGDVAVVLAGTAMGVCSSTATEGARGGAEAAVGSGASGGAPVRLCRLFCVSQRALLPAR